MHATLTPSRRRASEAPRSTGGRQLPPPGRNVRPASRKPDPGCVIAIQPFGRGVAYQVKDQIGNVVVEASAARDRDEAVELGRRTIRRRFGKGEPIYVLEVL
jgi:hypothetical protein